MTPKRISILIGAAVAAAALATGLAVAASRAPTAPKPAAAVATSGAPAYTWYRSMMSRWYGGSPMMGGTGYGWMMGEEGYRWMFGGSGAPAWMRGARIPATMMSTGSDPAAFMGSLWASAPGPRVNPGQAARDADQIPAGARVDRMSRTVTFTGGNVHLVAVAGAAGGFRVAGMVNPAITVPAGATVSVEVINADHDTAHGLVITGSRGQLSWMPMMTNRPAFTGSALWFLAEPTATGMHAGTLTFTATRPGSYRYLCPVPGHALEGMTGVFTVASS
jgi:rusticyanin